ncbi:MAG: hypothetical protein E6G08_07860 [Actinobacteria bacterium]|nr:MAG: hypothetical protein E6G08_07860 [Actinomycetota bacterium]
MTDNDRLDYDKTTELLRTLLDVRFKLLAFVPTISGAAVAFVGHGAKPAQLLSVGVLGLVATLGVLFYEVRNSQLYEYALRRAAELERRLGLGLFAERPGLSVRPFGIAAAGHHRGIALVYGAALGGWAYLVAWGGLRELGVGNPRGAGALIGIFLGLLILAELLRLDVRPKEATPERASAAPTH